MQEFNCYKATSATGKRRVCARCGTKGRLDAANGDWWIRDDLCNGCATPKEEALDTRRLFLSLAANNLGVAIHALDEAIENVQDANRKRFAPAS